MLQKTKILLSFLLIGPLVFGQTTEVRTATNEKIETGVLDSTWLKIHFHKNQFNHFNESMKFGVYSDTIIDSANITRIGMRIHDSQRSFDSIPVGIWREYYANGQLKSVQKFSVAVLTWCQFVGPTISGYSFKNGEASYYYPSGHLRASGVFAIETNEFSNNCGGDVIFHSKTDSLWRYYDEKGNPMEATADLIQEIELK